MVENYRDNRIYDHVITARSNFNTAQHYSVTSMGVSTSVRGSNTYSQLILHTCTHLWAGVVEDPDVCTEGVVHGVYGTVVTVSKVPQQLQYL